MSPLRLSFAAAILAGALALAGCEPDHSILNPQGPYATRIDELWWLLFWAGTIVFVIVMALLLYAHLPHRRRDEEGAVPGGDNRFIVVGGAIIPTVVILLVMIPTFQVGAELAPIPEGADPVIEIVGHQFWWEIRYPELGVVTANEVHIPVGRPVELILNTRDVIHAFWIPELAGKLDMIPGRENRTWIQADRAGVFRGACAEYCGIQHARMALILIAQEPAEFDAWVARQRQPAPEPQDPLALLGRDVYFRADCHLCHAVRGLVEPTTVGSPGPDLTHFASRLTLGSGIVENNRGNLGGWLLNPQHLKPGNRMPPTFLDPQSLLALITYMETLR
jgi:cytochrome c oxidase subunit II